MALVSGALGAALSYGNAAYNYNMSRFQFDAGQKQASVHQSQNLRISLWNLFREDVRDLFGITISNLNTYTVMGTLFLGFIVNMVWNGVKDFPEDPPWMILLYLNCLSPAVAFGVMSVWLAMHGTIAAHVASVKVLTQAVRPPIPTSSDVANISKNLAQYESANAETLLQVPNFFDWRGLRSASQNTSRQRNILENPPSTSEGPQISSERMLQARDEIEIKRAPLLTDPDGGPGSSALLGAHVNLFKQLQPTYLCFEAYSRVSLTLAAHYLLLTFSYFTLAHIYVWRSEKTGIEKHPQLVGWLAVMFLCFISCLLFQLDLFVSKWTRVRLVLTLFVGPIATCLAVCVWSWRADLRKRGGQVSSLDSIHQYLAILACILHILWDLSILWEARPCGRAMLPMSFRSIQYTDVFGWWYSKQRNPHAVGARPFTSYESEGPVTLGESEDANQEVNESLQQLGELSHVLEILSSERISLSLSEEVQQRILSIRESLTSIRLTGIPKSPTSSTSTRFGWLRCPFISDDGRETSYFVNIDTGEMSWELSETEGNAQIMDLSLLSEKVDALSQQVILRLNEDRGTSFSSDSIDTQAIGAFHDRTLQGDSNGMQVELLERPMHIENDRTGQVFAPMRRTPNSRRVHSGLAWKSFCQVSVGVICLWSLNIAWIALYGSSLGPDVDTKESPNSRTDDIAKTRNTQWPSLTSKMVESAWPRQFFRPSSMACSQNTIALGEQFSLFTAEFPSWPLVVKNNFVHVASFADLLVSWSSIALSHDSQTLLFSATSGGSVIELPVASSCEDGCQVATRWELYADTNITLRSIATIPMDLVFLECSLLKGEVPKWAVAAISTQNEIICFCPWQGHLVPMRTIRGPFQDEIDGLESMQYHGLVVDSDQTIWLLVHSTRGSQLRKLTIGGVLQGLWHLPTKRNWAVGLCSLRNRGLVASASSGTNIAELWHFELGNRILDGDNISSPPDGRQEQFF